MDKLVQEMLLKDKLLLQELKPPLRVNNHRPVNSNRLVNSKPVNSKPVNSKPVNSRPVNSKPASSNRQAPRSPLRDRLPPLVRRPPLKDSRVSRLQVSVHRPRLPARRLPLKVNRLALEPPLVRVLRVLPMRCPHRFPERAVL
jgi:hypothetical protein